MAFLNIDGEYCWMDGDGISVDKVIKKKIFMSAALMLLLGGVSANAETVDGYIVTSCGEVYHFSEVGDKVSKKQMKEFAKYIDWVYCG